MKKIPIYELMGWVAAASAFGFTWWVVAIR